MQIEISLHDGVPIYRQIVNQMKYLIASGQLAPGEELPTIRALAQQLTITPNTVVKAYGELEQSGLVSKRQGAGTFVSDAQSPLARRERRRILIERIDLLLTEAHQLDVPFDELLRLVNARIAKIQPGSSKEQS